MNTKRMIGLLPLLYIAVYSTVIYTSNRFTQSILDGDKFIEPYNTVQLTAYMQNLSLHFFVLFGFIIIYMICKNAILSMSLKELRDEIETLKKA